MMLRPCLLKPEKCKLLVILASTKLHGLEDKFIGNAYGKSCEVL